MILKAKYVPLCLALTIPSLLLYIGFQCAYEGDSCYCHGKVRFGLPPVWSGLINVDGKVECKEESFGPLNGINKIESREGLLRECVCIPTSKSNPI